MTLYYLFAAIPAIVMFALGLLVPMILVLCYSRFGAGMTMVFVAFVVDAITMGDGGLRLGINLFYADGILGLVAISTVLRFVFSGDGPKRNIAWVCFCALICMSLLSGLATYGTVAGVQARPYFYLVVAGSYAMSFGMSWERLRSVFDLLAATAVVLVLLTIYRWIVYYTPISDLLPPGGTYNSDGAIRVIRSNEALVLSQLLVAGFFFSIASRGFTLARVVSPVLFAFVIVLQHRSVWLALMVGFLASAMFRRPGNNSAFSQGLFVAAIVIVTSIPLLFSDRLSGEIETSAARALAGQDTTGERLKSWREIVKNWHGAGMRSVLIGQSFGTDNSRYVEDSHGRFRKITYTAHNYYIQTLFNVGLAGLSAFVLAALYVVSGLLKIIREQRGGIEAQVLLVMVVMQMVYYIPYGGDYLQSFLFGIALAYVAGKNVERGRAFTFGWRQRARA